MRIDQEHATLFEVDFRRRQVISSAKVVGGDRFPARDEVAAGSVRGVLCEDDLARIELLVKRLTDEAFRAVSSDLRVSDVAAQVAHDIRTPVQCLMNICADLEASPETPDAVVQMLRQCTTRINDMASGLLSKYRKQSAETVVQDAPKIVDLGSLVAGVLSELKPIASQSGAEVRESGLEGAGEIKAAVRVGEIQRAIANVVRNAIEAGGGLVEVSIEAEERSCRIRVRDNGAGIAPETIERVFEKGFTSGKSGGTGLGLHQAKDAIEWHGGRIHVSSELGVGTELVIELPRE